MFYVTYVEPYIVEGEDYCDICATVKYFSDNKFDHKSDVCLGRIYFDEDLYYYVKDLCEKMHGKRLYEAEKIYEEACINQYVSLS